MLQVPCKNLHKQPAVQQSIEHIQSGRCLSASYQGNIVDIASGNDLDIEAKRCLLDSFSSTFRLLEHNLESACMG